MPTGDTVRAMRNPIRLKNASWRYLPWYLVGVLALLWSHPSAAAFWGGGSLVLAGLVVRGWGAGHLVKNDELTLTGPYRYVRHPLYLGTLLIGIGFAVIAGGWLTLVLLPGLAFWFFVDYFPRKENSESARLEALYGDTFASYRERVPALVPSGKAWPSPASGSPSARVWELVRYSENNEFGTMLAVLLGLILFAARAGMAA